MRLLTPYPWLLTIVFFFPVTVHGFGIAVCSVTSPPNRSHVNYFFSVGLNNHRQFILFVSTLVGGVMVFDYLTYACMYSLPGSLFLF